MTIDYAPLPRSSSDLEDNNLTFNSFKDKPRRRSPRCAPSFLRKARRVCRPPYIFIFLLIFLSWQIIFNASYINPPPFLLDDQETVYIAANIIDADLINGAWGKSLLGLVDLIGKERVFVSIYGGPADALKELEAKLPCEKSIVSQDADPIPLNEIPPATPDGVAMREPLPLNSADPATANDAATVSEPAPLNDAESNQPCGEP